MKTKLTLTVILFILCISFTFKSSEIALPTESSGSNPFIIGCMNSYWDQTNHPNYDALGLNVMHSYVNSEQDYPGNSSRHTPYGIILSDDHLFLEGVPSGISSLISGMN